MMSKKRLEIYVHIPFCVRKCSYCDFLSFSGTVRMQKEYALQLIQEIKEQGKRLEDYQVVSVFLGGGTPSILGVEEIRGIMEALWSSFQILSDAEITLEANPGTIRTENLKVYRELGINRISIGLQSADDRELSYLGRIHTYDEFLKTYQRVRMAGFDNVNVDLISAIPGQTLESWKATLKKVAMLKPEHISAYSLIVEEGTPFYARYGSHVEMKEYHMTPEQMRTLMALPDLPDEDTERDMYYLTQSYLAKQGYERYEISNYARPGKECRHNVGYWTGIEYLGVGLGSSSYLGGCRFHNTADYRSYIEARLDRPEVFQNILRQDMEQLIVKSQMEEFMFLGLRLTQGVSAQEFISRFGQSIRMVYGPVVDMLSEQGLLEFKGGYYRLTSRGLDLSNYAMSQFLLD
ncbi:MAG TPA: radical SAM family heme chaperone HemW [Candidatus Hungatella pullicola]|nr:radical SAM family heme chaperone HemW [Candidatus Hungatella pullicola]